MTQHPIVAQSGRRRAQLGFTMVELALTITVIGIMAAMIVPKINQAIQASQVSRATALVANDLEAAFTLAGRMRQPMRITCNCGQGTYTIADRAGTIHRSGGVQSDDLGRLTMTFTAAPANTLPVEVFPTGISDKSLTVRITSGTHTRAVTMSTVGQVRIVP